MAYGLALFDDFLMRLGVSAVIWSPRIEEKFRKVEILFLTGYAIQFAKCHFDYLMAGPILIFSGAENLA
ncbi:hypothetical protein ES703_81322 [subsurface metagenome]